MLLELTSIVPAAGQGEGNVINTEKRAPEKNNNNPENMKCQQKRA